jgi:hypothetical protein
MAMQRFRVTWSNFPGAPGLSTFYLNPSITDYTPIRTFFTAVAGYLPNGLQLTFPSAVDTINESNGQLTASVGITPMNFIQSGVTAGAYSGASGAVVRWQTTGIWHGKRVSGRTYLVPLTSAAYGNDGTLVTAAITTLQGAANTLITSYGDGLRVWARPFAGTATRPARTGMQFGAISATVPDLAAVLRSRRF